MFHAVESDIRKTRRMKNKKNKKRIEMYGQEYVANETRKFVTDFPEVKYKIGDYKILKENYTFGNDKLITGKGFRTSYALAQGIITSILVIPVQKIEECIH